VTSLSTIICEEQKSKESSKSFDYPHLIFKLFFGGYRITQLFGNKLRINGKEYYPQFGLKGHEGLDVVPKIKGYKAIYTPADGIVLMTRVSDGRAYGHMIRLWHPQYNLITEYCHLDKICVAAKEPVRKGTHIGTMGNTGSTFGTHLHMNVIKTNDKGEKLNKKNGYLGGIDPLLFLEGRDYQI